MQAKFKAASGRVKGVSFHPSKPWVITSLHTSSILIWDYSLGICIAKLEGHNGPIRGIDFHPQLPIFVSGADDSKVKVWDYKQKRCNFTLQGHIDYIRSTFFHHELPWILSASDDQTMRIWNYQSRACVNIITGHCHYVMCAQFHKEKNYIVSASLDSTIRIWDFSVLRKKLTESHNISSYIGIEIECIKILEGHERGCNWVAFHPTSNLIASCSDDRKIKLWKYTNEVAWQHATLSGHKRNVSCVLFDQKTGYLISNAEDATIKVWNIETKQAINTISIQKSRYWIMSTSHNSNYLAAGHDLGIQVFQLNRQVVPYASIFGGETVVFAQGLKTYFYDLASKVQKMDLHQYDGNIQVLEIQKIIPNTFNSSYFAVKLKLKDKEISSFMIKKKIQYLDYPSVVKTVDALDACFPNVDLIVFLQQPQKVSAIDLKFNKKKSFWSVDKKQLKGIFHYRLPDIIMEVAEDQIILFNIEKFTTLSRYAMEANFNIQSVLHQKDKSILVGSDVIYIRDKNFEESFTIRQSNPIHSVFCDSPNLLLYTTRIHWKYAIMNGETGILMTVHEPINLLKRKNEETFLAFNHAKKVFEIKCPQYRQIDFKLAIQMKNWAKVKEIIKEVGPQRKNFIVYLLRKGYSSIALELVKEPQEKFALAVQATNFQVAFQVCNQINTPEYWKMLGQEALHQGVYQAYELSSQKLKQYHRLNFLYSLQGNTPKLQKLMKLSAKTNNPILAMNTAMYLNERNEIEKQVREAGFEGLAEMARSVTSVQEGTQRELSNRLKKLGSKPLPMCKPVEQDFSNWIHNVLEDEQDD